MAGLEGGQEAMKKYIVGLSFLALIAGTLFWRDVWAIFAGMSVIESLTAIVNFVLHVAVATIIGYVVMTLPEFVKPWIKTFRWKQRSVRRGRTVEKIAAPAGIKLTRKDQALYWLIEQAAKKDEVSETRKIAKPADEKPNTIRLNF